MKPKRVLASNAARLLVVDGSRDPPPCPGLWGAASAIAGLRRGQTIRVPPGFSSVYRRRRVPGVSRHFPRDPSRPRQGGQGRTWGRERFGTPWPGKRARTRFAEGLAGIKEIEMVVAVMTLVIAALIFGLELRWLARC
jgi:hypothetical protein